MGKFTNKLRRAARMKIKYLGPEDWWQVHLCVIGENPNPLCFPGPYKEQWCIFKQEKKRLEFMYRFI